MRTRLTLESNVRTRFGCDSLVTVTDAGTEIKQSVNCRYEERKRKSDGLAENHRKLVAAMIEIINTADTTGATYYLRAVREIRALATTALENQTLPPPTEIQK